MKIFFSEHQTEYSTYTFSYSVYCIKEEQVEIPEIYAKGFLPYTGDFAIKKDIFYLARSVRVDLNRFKDTSENRRVHRLVEPLRIEVIPVEKFSSNLQDNAFLSFCTNYAEDRFSGGSMDEERMKYIFSRNSLTHIFTFRSKEKLYGYVFAAIHGNMLHYWYSFFDIEYLKTHSLGKWMLWKTIHWAKDNNLRYVYLGTCYKTKALYKVRDHKGAEFFNGVHWNDDLQLLKYLCKLDEENIIKKHDMMKSSDAKMKTVFKKLFE